MQTTTVPDIRTQSIDTGEEIPSLEWQLVRAIICEGQTDPEGACLLMNLLAKVASKSQAHDLTRRELRRVHPILDRIIKDHAVAKPGSAHDLANRFFLPAGMCFWHTRNTAHIFKNRLKPCAVAVQAIPIPALTA